MEAVAVDAERQLFRDSVKRFLMNEVAPDYADWGRAGIVPRNLWRQLGEAGLLCMDVPEHYGGHEAPFEYSQAILEEVACLGFGALVSNLAVHSDVVAPDSVTTGPMSRSSAICRLW